MLSIYLYYLCIPNCFLSLTFQLLMNCKCKFFMESSLLQCHLVVKTIQYQVDRVELRVIYFLLYKLNYLQHLIINLKQNLQAYFNPFFTQIMQGGIPTIIPQQILQLKQIFGVNVSIPRSISLLPSDRLFYISGYYGIVYNPKQKEKSQSYYSGADDCQTISTVTLSSNKKLMAMGFKSTQKPCIYYYELNASAKRRKIEYTDNFSFTSWVSLAFSANSDIKHLASLTNKNSNGQSILAFWNPQRGKCQAQFKIQGKEDKDFAQILFNPNSQNLIVSVLGQKTLKFYELKQNIEEKSFFVEELEQKTDDQLCMKYTLRSHLYLGTSQNILVLADQGCVIVDYKTAIQQKIATHATCSANWSEGFVIAHKKISIFKYEDQKYKEKFVYQNFSDKDVQVSSISVNDDKILVLLSNGCFMIGKIKTQSSKNTVRLSLEAINLHYHSGPIVGMDICVRKPLIATASKDKTIKIWNYQQRTVQTPKSDTEAASCLSFHPSGLHLAVAYTDKLRILNLQKDGESMSNYKDINSFRNCTCIKFSNGGQYLAAASGNMLHLFKFYTGQNPTGMTFTGHSGKIKCIAWNKEDNIVVTCGTDGIILAYRVGMENCGHKLLYMHSSKQPRIKGISYSSVAITQDNTIYAIGSIGNGTEKVFREIKLDGSDNKRQLAQNNSSQLCFPSTGRILFCGTEDKDKFSGSIKCYKFPNTQHMEEFQAHDHNGVQKLCVTSDDKYLVSAGKDGALMVFQIRDKEARSDKLREVLPISNQILITKTDMDTIKAEIDNLKQEKAELEGPNNSGPIKDDHVKQLKDKYHSDETQFLQKYNGIIQKKNLLKKKFDQQVRTKKEQFENGLQQYDSNQAKNVMQESAKYDELKRSQEEQSRQFTNQIERYKRQNQKDLKKLEEDYQQKIKNQRDRKNDIKRKIQRLEKQHEETMRQILQEKQEELKKIQNQYSQQVQNITQASLRAKSDVSITKKKIQEKKQEEQNNAQQQRENQEEIKRLEKANEELEKDIENQAHIIQDRDKTIDANQRKIYELKKKAQELEKFKYVLDHKIKQLKKDIAPRQQQITKMKAQTNKMDKQLKDLNSLNTGLAEFVAALFKNEQSLKAKISQQRNRISYQNNKIKSFKDALYSATQLIQNQEQLKHEVTELKNKFVSHSMVQAKMDSQIQNQYKNQKKYLQKSIAMLKKNLQKDSEIHKHENIRIMKENVALIKQISSLRIEIRQDNNKRGSDDDKKSPSLGSTNNNKNEPKQEEVKAQIEMKKNKIEFMKRQIEDIQERINNV